MASPNEKLAESLLALKALQNQGHRAVRSKALSRTHRERLYEDRMKALDIASSEGNSTFFAQFIARLVREQTIAPLPRP